MKQISTMLSLALISLWLAPLSGAAETDPDRLIVTLNNKTAMIRGESENEDKSKALTTKNLEVNSYIFALDQKDKLKIDFTEEIQTYNNGQYIDKNLSVGKASFDPADIDPERIEIGGGLLSIICRELKNCVNRENHDREINAKGETTYEATNSTTTYGFQLSGLYNQPLAEQIRKDLQVLFTLLTPPEPAQKSER